MPALTVHSALAWTRCLAVVTLMGCGSGHTDVASSWMSSGGETTVMFAESSPQETCGFVCSTGTSTNVGEPMTTDTGGTTDAVPDRVAFVTSIRYNAGELQSLYLADAICVNRADDAGLEDPLGFRAWLSDSVADARDRFPTTGDEQLVLIDGRVLAPSWRALLSGHLTNPFNLTLAGEVYEGRVWTGTLPNGTAAQEHCEGWSTDSFLKTGTYGYSTKTTTEWTMSKSTDNPTPCPSDNALYCIYAR